MAKKNIKGSKSLSTKKPAGKTTGSPKDVSAFVDHLRSNKGMMSKLKKGWSDAIQEGKKKGFKFTRQQLRDHLKNRYKIHHIMKDDEPDTCVCI